LCYYRTMICRVLRTWKALPLFCVVASMTGCLSGPFAPAEMDKAAKAFAPPEGKANIYVVRDAAWPGYRCEVLMDNLVEGWIGADSFSLVSVVPGQHVTTCTIFDHTARADFVAQAGRNYFFEVIASPGWNTPMVELRALSEETGKSLVNRGRRSAGTPQEERGKSGGTEQQLGIRHERVGDCPAQRPDCSDHNC
jgi:hypothetical protein